MRILVWAVCVALFIFVLTACSATTKTLCPSLSPPPGSIVDALEQASEHDPNAASWTIGLERHYAKLDACR
jgi:hypothetical protein